jgi:hypothetical protein
VDEEQNEEDMVPSKHGNVWEPPLSQSTYDINHETKNSIVMHDFFVSNNDDATKEYTLDMLYDNALDDGPMILYDPPSLEISTNMCKDKNDMLAIYDDTLIHESPIVFLDYPNHTIEEKYACVLNYLYDLELSYACKVPVCNHEAVIQKESMIQITMVILVILFVC